MSPKRQFLILFSSSLFGLFLSFLINQNSFYQLPTIQQINTSQDTFELKIENKFLEPNQTFSVILGYHTSQPVQFLQALLEFDPNIIKIIPPDEKLHSLNFHKFDTPQRNQIKITANSINPLNLINHSDSLEGNGDIAKLNFIVIGNQSTQTQIKFIVPDKNNTDWNKTNLVFLDNLLSPNQILNHTPESLVLDIILPSPSPSPTPSATASANLVDNNPSSSSNSASFIEYLKLFPMIASQASEIIEASPSSYLIPSPEATFTATLPIPEPKDEQPLIVIETKKPTFWDNIITKLNQI